MKNKRNQVISGLLFIIGLVLTINHLYIVDGSFLSVNYSQSEDRLHGLKNNLLLKGEKVTGTFVSKSNGLGGVSFRFDNKNKTSTDSVIFRLTEKNSNELIYQGIYKVDQFQPKKLFPFGFPIISDSRNKTFGFEIESLNGTENNAIALSTTTPIFSIKYQFSKTDLNTIWGLFRYASIKLQSLLNDKEFYIYLVTYLSPFILINLFYLNGNSRKKKLLFIFIPVLIIISNFFSNEKFITLAFPILIADWCIVIMHYRLSSIYDIIMSLLFCMFSGVFVLYRQPENVEKAITWTYIFIVISIAHLLYEIYFSTIKSKFDAKR